MDPDACLADLEWTLKEDPSDRQDLDCYCEALHAWLTSGGFEPTWTTAPNATAYYRAWVYETETGREYNANAQ